MRTWMAWEVVALSGGLPWLGLSSACSASSAASAACTPPAHIPLSTLTPLPQANPSHLGASSHTAAAVPGALSFCLAEVTMLA